MSYMLKSARIQAVSSSSHHNDKVKLDLISVPNDLRRFRPRITHLLDPLDRASFSGNPGKFIKIILLGLLRGGEDKSAAPEEPRE
jgi:hypothetical protein